jgi:hypothetical protein
MRLWRRKGSDPARRPQDAEHDRQVWVREPKPTDALIPQFPELGDTHADAEKERVYADEIDPAWADPDTAEPAGPGDSAGTT